MMFSKSKSKLAGLGAAQQQLEQSSRSLQDEIEKSKATLRERTALRDHNRETLRQLQSDIETAGKETSTLRSKIEESKLEVGKISGELASVQTSGAEGGKASRNAQKAFQEIEALESSLNAVHEELRMLSSNEAKKAALEAAGGDLPTDIVRPPVKEAQYFSDPAVDSENLWLATRDETNQVPAALRDALQSQAVLAALQKSLTVRAAELREGLRQWGFSQTATKRTKELCIVLEGSLKDGKEGLNKMQNEHTQLLQEREGDLASHAKIKVEHESLSRTGDIMATRVTETIAQVTRFEEKRDTAQKRLHELQQTRVQVASEHTEAMSQIQKLETQRAELQEETSRRTVAAQRLVERCHDQVQKATKDLEQAKQEFDSFRQAHAILQEANASLARELQTSKDAHEDLEDEHDALNVELNALARHYTDLLPAGMGGPHSPPLSPLNISGPPLVGSAA